MEPRHLAVVLLALGLALAVLGGADYATGGALTGLSATSLPPSLRVSFVSVQPLTGSLSHAVGGSDIAPATAMVQVYLGSYAEDLKTMTGGPMGFCNGGSCNTAVFGATLTISWGDGSTSQIPNYWLDMNNVYAFTSITPPGDGVGAGYAYDSFQAFYHVYQSPGNYTVTATAASGAAISPAVVNVMAPASGSGATTTTTSLPPSNPPANSLGVWVDSALAGLGAVAMVSGALVWRRD